MRISRRVTSTKRSSTTLDKAIKYHTQHRAIAKMVGDRAREGQMYGNLGNAYWAQGDFGQAIEHHTQDIAIAKEVGDRAGEGRAYRSLSACQVHWESTTKQSPTTKTA